MNGTWPPFAAWLVHSVLGGGFLLLVAVPLMAACRQPARRQRLGEAALLAALVLWLLNLAPPWIALPLPSPEEALGPPAFRWSLADQQELSEADSSAPSRRHEELAQVFDLSASSANSAPELMSG